MEIHLASNKMAKLSWHPCVFPPNQEGHISHIHRFIHFVLRVPVCPAELVYFRTEVPPQTSNNAIIMQISGPSDGYTTVTVLNCPSPELLKHFRFEGIQRRFQRRCGLIW